MLALATGCSTERSEPAASPTSQAASRDVGEPAPSYAANRRAAAAESARVLALAPVPKGSIARPENTADERLDMMSIGPSDPSLTRSRWFSVPMGPDELERYLLEHVPAGFKMPDGVGGGSDGVRSLTYIAVRSAEPDAFIAPTLLVQWAAMSGTTTMHVDAVIAARLPRTPGTRVHGTVSSVDIRHVDAGRTGSAPSPILPYNQLERTLSQDLIDRLVDAANRLPGSISPAFMALCPFPGDPPESWRLTFHTSDGDLEMAFEPSCWDQVHVTRDGRPLEPTLDPDGFAATVTAIAHARQDLGNVTGGDVASPPDPLLSENQDQGDAKGKTPSN